MKLIKYFSLILFFINLYGHSYAQSFMGEEVDSLGIIIYFGSHDRFPLAYTPLPPYVEPSKKYQERLAKFEAEKKVYYQKLGDVDTTWQMNHFSIDVMDKNEKFNPSIIWKSKQVFLANEVKEIERILLKKDYTTEQLSSIKGSAMCFMPKHSILLYKNGKVISHYDICFQCNQVKKNRKEYLPSIDFIGLQHEFRKLNFPTFKEDDIGESYGEYKKRMSQEKIIKIHQEIYYSLSKYLQKTGDTTHINSSFLTNCHGCVFDESYCHEKLNTVAYFLKKKSHLQFKISVHTGCKGKSNYNLHLSKRHAEQLTFFLIENGIDKNTFTISGKGECCLINHCDCNNDDCTYEEESENYRIEFIVK